MSFAMNGKSINDLDIFRIKLERFFSLTFFCQNQISRIATIDQQAVLCERKENLAKLPILTSNENSISIIDRKIRIRGRAKVTDK